MGESSGSISTAKAYANLTTVQQNHSSTDLKNRAVEERARNRYASVVSLAVSVVVQSS
jgi:hypothetical protein